MTKRIVSGIFILTALGALGVILAGALTSGEQLIVRFLTAVIVAALGLYVISDLRLQADDDAMTARSGGPTRLATVDAPPNSTAAFMATVTKKVDPASLDPAAAAAGNNTELLQTTVLANGDPKLMATGLPPAPQPHQQPAGAKDGRRIRSRRSVSSHPNAPKTVFAAGPLGAAVDPRENDEAATESPGLGAFADSSNVTDLFGANGIAHGRIGADDGVTKNEDGDVDQVTTQIDKVDSTDDAVVIGESDTDVLNGDESNVLEVAAIDDGADHGNVAEEGIAPLDIDLPEFAAELEDADLGAPKAEEESPELVGSMAGVSGGIIDALGTFKSNGTAERNGHSGNNGHSGPFDLASTTAKISFSNDPLGDNVSFGSGIRNGTHSTDDGTHSTDDGTHSTDDGTHSTDDGSHTTDDGTNGHSVTGDVERNGHHAPIETELSDTPAIAGDNREDEKPSDFTYSDELQSPETVWPAPQTPLNGSGTYISFETPRNGDGENGHGLNLHRSLPAPAVDAELQAAEYADAPLAPIIDLRNIGTPATGTVDMAINVGEVEVIATLIEQGMLSTDGPISDRDVRTMVYVAFTSNELRKLLLAGGTPDGPNHGLDLGPVELFDERIHAPAPKTLYSGIDRPEAQSQLG